MMKAATPSSTLPQMQPFTDLPNGFRLQNRLTINNTGLLIGD
jgi:hypothetical protein